jgi:ribosome-associated toxin RatA of RatAB toxin-antitoxin module
MADTPCRNTRRFPALKPILRIAVLRIILAALALALTLQDGASGRTVPDLSEDQLHRLEQGDIVVSVNQAEGPARGTVEATILIEAPVDLIWRIMNDCEEIPNFIPGIEKCEVLESGENWEFIRHEIKWIWLFPRLSYVFRADYLPKREISFNRISGDLREMKGSWRLIPAESSGTFVRYRVYLDPGFLIPQWLVRNSLKSDIPAVLTALRNKVLAIQGEQEE